MIENKLKTANYISNWMKDYANNAGRKSLVLGLSGGIDSALIALLCKRTGLPVICIGMPCHSSDSAWLRAEAFAKDYNLHLRKVDLSEAHDSIYNQCKDAKFPFTGDLTNKIAVGGLRSCLRAPTLNFFSNVYGSLIISSGNRSEDNITRYFQKFGDGCVDIAPIADLFKSEVRELFAWLATSTVDYKMAKSAQDILDAKPTADLWGPDAGQEDEKELGITYDEIEWADREDMRTQEFHNATGIIKRDADPTKNKEWYRYTSRQKEVIAKLHQIEKISRHKVNPNLPMCELRKIDGLLR